MASSKSRGQPSMLIPKILRNKIMDCKYWKQHCFYLTAKTLIDKAVQLRSFGGTYSAFHRPTPFVCLLLKLLQLRPEEEIIQMFLADDHFRYVRLLAAFYVRLTKTPVQVYTMLEPLLLDSRKLKRLVEGSDEYVSQHMDEAVDELLRDDSFCSVQLPVLVKRYVLENSGIMEPRVSPLQEEFQRIQDESSSSSSSGSSSSSSSSSEDGDDDSFDKTNRIRRSLGMAPLHRN